MISYQVDKADEGLRYFFFKSHIYLQTLEAES